MRDRYDQLPVKAIAEAVLESLARLGLMWRLRPATVASVETDGTPHAIFDGDTVPIRVVSMVGPVAVNARVMVMTSPPSGNHIVGWAGPPAPGGGPDGLALAEANSAAVTAQTVVLSVPMILRARTAYRVELGGGVAGSTAAVQPLFRLFRAGAVPLPLGEFYRYPVFGGPVANCDGTRYIRRVADTDLPATIQLTLEAVAGSGTTATHVGAVGRPRFLQITACGEAAKFPHAVAVT
ncbi:hypothetical protein ACQEVC_34370 [Plantactinospora sp. CA-294935]|uniref:hypothetical protein n=1 Tax=Plantactinospora sp. CA-294935 TaxID=3240012 RepID=UPI003D91EF22